jgi:hypothetical protein
MASVISALTSGAGGISMTGDASGILNLNSNGTNVVAVTSTGVAVTGTLAATGAITGSSTVAGSTGILYPLTSGTAVASTSGTSIDFTGIPSWVKRITVMFNGVSTNGASLVIVRVGSGSITTTGYVAAVSAGASNTTSTTEFLVNAFANTAYSYIGHLQITLISGNTYVSSGINALNIGNTCISAGNVTLAGVLDRLRITTQNGTDTFDAGSVNILYE